MHSSGRVERRRQRGGTGWHLWRSAESALLVSLTCWSRGSRAAELTLVDGLSVDASLTQCVLTIVGASPARTVATVRLSRNPTDRQQAHPFAQGPEQASIVCNGTTKPTFIMGPILSALSDSFIGITTVADETLPGSSLRIVDQQPLIIKDSRIAFLEQGADAALVIVNTTVTIINSTFQDNVQAGGGALWVNNSKLVVYDSLFLRNRAYQAGGIYAMGKLADVSVNLTTFRANNGTQGGGIGMTGGGKLQVLNSLFIQNAAENGAGIFTQKLKSASVMASVFKENLANVNGAGVCLEMTSSAVTATRFINNQAQTGAGSYFNRCPDLVIKGNDYVNNSAVAGGAGIEMNQCTGNVDSCRFLRNRGEKGGGLFMDGSTGDVSNCTFDANQASLLGGGLYRSFPQENSNVAGSNFTRNRAGQAGGAIYEQNVRQGSVQGCSFGRNDAPAGLAIYSRMCQTDFARNINLLDQDLVQVDE